MPLTTAPVPIAPEFRVNTFVTGNQHAPSAMALADGGFLVTWLSDDPIADIPASYAERQDVHAQRYTADGAANGEEFRVNAETLGNQFSQSVAVLADGGFVVFWMSYDPSTYDPESFSQRTDIFGQRYAADGTALDHEFRASATMAGGQYAPAVTGLADGGFVVLWHVFHDAGRDADIFAQRYTADGAPSGDEFRVNATMAGGQHTPAVAALADGGFVVSWGSIDVNGESNIFAQRYTADGAPSGDEFRVNATMAGGQHTPAVAALADGGFVVSWDTRDADGDAGIHARCYDANGIAEGDAFVVAAPSFGDFGATVAALTDGGFVVSWNDFNSAGLLDISARRYAADGTALTGEFSVYAPTDTGHAGPTAAGLADGGFVISWGGQFVQGPVDVLAVRYAADGSAVPPASANKVCIAAHVAANDEGDRGPAPFTFTVSLGYVSNTAQSVEWRVDQHGAHTAEPNDFTDGGLPSGLLVFAPGETQGTIVVEVAGDTAAEGDESFAVLLLNPSEGLVIGGEGRAEALILNDDAPMVPRTAHEAKVARLYDAALDRSADGEGFAFWVAALEKGEALPTLASGFLASEEFAARFGDAADGGAFVDRLYRNVLGRDGEAEGRGFWCDSLGEGWSRAEVLVGFSESAEHVALTAGALRGGADLVIG